MLEAIRAQYLKHGTVEKIEHRTDLSVAKKGGGAKKGRSGRSVTGTVRDKQRKPDGVKKRAAKS